MYMYMVTFKTKIMHILFMYMYNVWVWYYTAQYCYYLFFQEIKKKEAEFAETIPPHLKIFEK